VNVGSSHIVPFFIRFFDDAMLRLLEESKLSKFLPDVLAEPARFYFWQFLRRLWSRFQNHIERRFCGTADPRKSTL
jgi:hypothetical protein